MVYSKKIMVIGLDAGDPDLIAQWADEGVLPTFRRLLEGTTHARVQNPRAMEAGAAWPTFYYGTTPARHGQYDGTRLYDPATYKDAKYTPELTHPLPIWKALSDAGRRVALVDPPYRFMAEGLNGVDLHDWGPHAPTSKNSFATFDTWPATLKSEIETRFGLDPLGGAMCDKFAPRSLEDQTRFRDQMVDRAIRKGKISEYIWGLEDWDFFLTVFSECHCIGHHGWHIHDHDHPAHDPKIAEAIGDPMKDVYIALDTAIGSLIDKADDNTIVVVYSSHGIGKRYSATKLLDKILLRLEGGNPREVSHPVVRLMRNTWRSLPVGLRNKLKPTQAKLYKEWFHDGFQGDRESRRFFEVLVNDRTAGIRFNLKDREPNGKVHPDEYDALCDELQDKLLKIVNVDTGLPLVKEVVKTRETYEGDLLYKLPDLLVTWNRIGNLSRIKSPDIGEMMHENLSFRTGDHRPEGVFFVVTGEEDQNVDLGYVSSCDFAPTFAKALGVELPITDGKPIDVICGHAPSSSRRLEPV